jgi:50S ribosomal protein L16 3-hydroxylase
MTQKAHPRTTRAAPASTLGKLLQPQHLAEFADCFAAGRPFVAHGLGKSIAALTRLPLLRSLEALLGAWPKVVKAHLPDVADESSSIDASPEDARKLFANGMGLLFDDVHTLSPVVAGWLEQLRGELGLSALTQSRSLVYATPAGGGTAPHFDQNVNFVLQLHGRKTWWLARNDHVDHPLTRHTMGLAADPELQTYARLPFPTAMPRKRQAIVLEAGSCLFVPRGTWHSTEAASDALSLNFTFTAPSWLDLFSAALRSRLALSSAWRATALPAQAETFAALLRELADDAPGWRAEDVLSATEGAAVRRAAAGSLE